LQLDSFVKPVVPAGSRAEPQEVLSSHGTGNSSKYPMPYRAVLLMAEMGMSLILLSWIILHYSERFQFPYIWQCMSPYWTNLEESVNFTKIFNHESLVKVSVLFEIKTSTANPATLHFKFIVCANVVKCSLLALCN
jgi:hypothetical protein